MTESASLPGASSGLEPVRAGLHRGGARRPGPSGPLLAENVAEALSGGPSRRLLAACVDAAMSVKGLSSAAGVPLATAYRHVHRLLTLGVLVVERSAMTPDGKKYDLYRSRVKEAHLDLSGGGEAVRWVANDAIEERLIGWWDALRA